MNKKHSEWGHTFGDVEPLMYSYCVGDEFGLGGMLYCRYCHTPREKRIVLNGEELIIPILCKCRVDARNELRRVIGESKGE